MKTSAAVLCTSLMLTACTGATALDNHFENPLYAEWYYQDLVDEMVELVLREDPLTKDEKKLSIIDDTRRNALQLQKEAEAQQNEGLMGGFVSDIATTRGEALLLENMLYLGQDFDTIPGPSLRLYLTTAVDPRDAAFPDETAIDLGALKNAYGAQAYALPENDEEVNYRTLVLWDEKLERLYGFAQLHAR